MSKQTWNPKPNADWHNAIFYKKQCVICKIFLPLSDVKEIITYENGLVKGTGKYICQACSK